MRFIFAFVGPIIAALVALNEAYGPALIILAIELAWVAWEVARLIETQLALVVAGDDALQKLEEKISKLAKQSDELADQLSE